MLNNRVKSPQITTICLVVVSCLLLSLFAFLPPSNAFAEETQTQIVTFNQQINLSTATNRSSSSSNLSIYSDHVRITSTGATYGASFFGARFNINYSESHLYYIKIETKSNKNFELQVDNFWYTFNTNTIDSRQVNSGTRNGSSHIYVYNSSNLSLAANDYLEIYIMVIDLTLMFSEVGSVPTLNECNALFPSQFYPYTTGQLMQLGNTDDYYSAYMQGVNDVLDSFTFELANSEVQIAMQSTNVNTSQGGEVYKYSEYVRIDPIYSTNPDSVVVGYLPFNTTIQANTPIKVSGMASHTGGNQTDRGYVGYLNVNNVVNVASYSVIGGSGWSTFNVQINVNAELKGLYFILGSESDSFYLKNVKVEFQTQNIYDLVQNAYSRGQYEAEQNYIPYAQGWNEIYQLGLREGSTRGDSIIGNGWDFVSGTLGSLGSFFSIELLPNITLGTFIAIPLIFGLLFLIIKITRGG